MSLLDSIGFIDFISRIEGVVSTFLNADWAGARQKKGYIGYITETFSSVISHNAPTIRVSRQTGVSGIEIERLLYRYGVKVWDRGVIGPEYFFCVKRRQVKWAEYVLLRAGIPVTSSLRESRNTEWAARHPTHSLPTQRR